MANKESNGYGYKKTMFREVPPKCVLVIKNIFTGSYESKEAGLRFVNPVTQSCKLVSIAPINDSYKNLKCKTLEGYDVTVDVDLTIRITDACKFEFESLNPLDILHTKMEESLRGIVVQKAYDELKAMKIDLNAPDFQEMKLALEDLNNKYGLNVDEINFKEISLDESLKSVYEQKIIQDKENERRISEAKANLEVAQMEVERKSLELKPFVDAAVNMAIELKKAGFTKEESIRMAISYVSTRSENANQFISIGDAKKDTDAALIGAVVSALNGKTKSLKNSNNGVSGQF